MTEIPEGGAPTTAPGGIVLELDGVCIQTAARRAHREIAAALLAGGASAGADEARLETLAAFLSSADFPLLRSRHPELAGGTNARVAVRRGSDGGIRWEILPPACP